MHAKTSVFVKKVKNEPHTENNFAYLVIKLKVLEQNLRCPEIHATRSQLLNIRNFIKKVHYK